MSHSKPGGRAAGGRVPGRVAPRLDAANLAGITTLMNPQHLKPGINLDGEEKKVMGKTPTGGSRRPEGDPVRLYTAELNQLAEELGIDLLDEGDPGTTKAPAPQTPAPGGRRVAGGAAPGPPVRPSRPPLGTGMVTGLIDNLDLGTRGESRDSRSAPRDSRPTARGSRPAARGPHPAARGRRPAPRGSRDRAGDSLSESSEGGSASGSSEGETGSETGSSGSYSEGSYSEESYSGGDSETASESGTGSSSGTSEGDSEEGTETESSADDEKVDRIIERLESDLGIRTDGRRERRRNRVRGETEVPHVERRRGDRVTDEQERRRHINSVVSDIRGETRTTFGVERERIQDIKASKLEQIGQLRMSLEEEGIDCTSVSNPTSESPMEEIDSVLNILRLKNDRNRYSSLAEEAILGFAEGIETVLDGTRAIPLLGWRPDYTGYHATCNVKLHRMRFETSQVVGNIIEKYNIGPSARIFLELLPSFFLYPRQQKKQRGAPGLSSDPHVADSRMALNTIRAADERRSLDDVRNL